MSLKQRKEELNILLEKQRILEKKINENQETNRNIENNLYYAMDYYINEIYDNMKIDCRDFYNKCMRSYSFKESYQNIINNEREKNMKRLQHIYGHRNQQFLPRIEELFQKINGNHRQNFPKDSISVKELREFGTLLNDHETNQLIQETIEQQLTEENLPVDFKLMKTFSKIIKQQQHVIQSIFTP